ncbi:undecaprenyldiphospho-muramoylpentapeptide beta-N-acetylglucosaminyltransferase [Raoultibacter phocaeensis]|uniref:undecaprenyldiphospho-muramoylpentapeptide beta-N-acetylglucosaminyltransferase n=1 Tax=Raoultibacter phocaeensis TaxID=2479841 RepID=UPI001118BF55|nr:undecaprenyldiphospho-muramoylpentapeptide beta-N-acetylglucosaminyltransferase [Raoultibacter phocaeensis]
MVIVLSGGGTAGHINPALAVAEVLQERGHTVLFAGTPQGVEARLVREANIPFTAFEAAGFDRSRPASILSAVRKILKSTRDAKRWFFDVKPDVVVGFGGYVSIPVGRAAEIMGIPVVVHEQNSVMGMANKYLAKHAKTVALTYEVAGSAVEDASKIVVTGNPVRSSVLAASRAAGREMLGVPDDALMLLVFGGSLGARHLNSAVVALKEKLLDVENLYVVHVTGPKELEAVEDALALSEEEKKRWLVFGYQDRMGETLAASDAVVSRAGATSLAEISALHLPSLLVPFPFATEDHQTKNAQAYVAGGAAYLVSDDEVEGDGFATLLFSMIEDEAVRERMREASKQFKTKDAASRLADVVIAAV